MKRMRFSRPLAILGASCAFALAASAVIPGQLDDFEDGTTQGWFVALLGQQHPAPPQNIPDGGPGGDGDNYMLLTAIGGDGPGSRLAVMNADPWAGDYLAAGVTSITMDLCNFSETDLYIRLLFEDPTIGPPENVATTEAVFLPADSGWMTATFPIGLVDLIPLLGDVTALMSNVTMLRIFHNPAAEFPPPPVVAQLGADNIHAVEEPTSTETASWGRVKNLFR